MTVNRRLCFCCFLVQLALASALTASSEPEHFRKNRYEGERVIVQEHFKFPDHRFWFDGLEGYAPFHSVGGALLRYESKTEEHCHVEISKTTLNQIPSNEESALKFYQAEIAKLNSPNFIKDARVREINMPSAYPQTYLLSKEESSPPTKMVTYLVYPPYLYRITIDTGTVMKGRHRTDYETILRSLQFDPPLETPESSKPQSEIKQTEPK
jgi:hypothetical protein